MSFPHDCTLKELKELPQFSEVGNYILYFPGPMSQLFDGMVISKAEGSGWSSESMIYGLERLEQATGNGSCLFPVYDPSECADDGQKKDVNVIFFPKTEDHGEKPFIVICAGGGFMGVCSAAEGYPIAARFNEIGYDAFILNYRVGGEKIMPKPVDDLAAAVRYILDRQEAFGVGENYILCGFSAGASLICLFGTENLGYPKYGLPAPKAMIPVYAFVDLSQRGSSPVTEMSISSMYGKELDPAFVAEYDICSHLGNYPPCYLVCGLNDSTVPAGNSARLKKCLEEKGIPVVWEAGEYAEHGFGEGRGTDVEGWYLRADRFVEEL